MITTIFPKSFTDIYYDKSFVVVHSTKSNIVATVNAHRQTLSNGSVYAADQFIRHKPHGVGNNSFGITVCVFFDAAASQSDSNKN